ncbi:hypothetical protein P5673_018759 [Acropora cervicornis]|uniref:Reverse transcriptase domain-containing protein n=1 Tax=Acropora cervicornis TaxID=6130 RepID=A0AAD9QBY9_ACRCE|nr:hypothetical protein P5673_018759 [Acropora cervicornis]
MIKNIQVDGKLCTNNKKIANAFNMFFTSAVTGLRQSLDLGSNARKFTHVVNHSLPYFKFKMVDESFTLNALRQLKTNKSGGLDDISPRLLKDAAEGKTECILFGTGPKLALSTSFSVAIDGKALNRVSEYKYLGIVLDASLTWNAHVDYLIGKVRKRLAMLGRIRKNINMYTAGTVYTSFVLPILDRCDTVWSCCGSVNTDKLEKLQRRAARIIMHLGSSEKALNLLGYVTLEKRRESHVCNLVKKCLSNRCP